ncbi:MAG TPA: TonB-dependent receptor plug domain-containing protein, partial [Phnomibacter sp.]|nr:TonB-dependent receptor plug domain-containing protein [Phnomibacter sp.]
MRRIALAFLCLVWALGALAQGKTVTGKVTDSKDGSALAGVTVTVQGATGGTSTGSDGSYSIAVGANAKNLVFSYVGFQTVTLAIPASGVLNVSMAAEEAKLEEVVVVGYGTQQKKAFTGSAAKVDAKQFANLVTPSVDRQLSGRAAGVQVATPGGLVNTPARIRVRGINSISGNLSPLIVVDGVPFINGNLAGTTNSNALGDINPNDIENIEVLKDGSATAIFGSRAAGGVIMITT